MKYAIIEDEPLAAERLQQLVQRLRPAWECLMLLDSVEDSVQWLQEHDPDLLFLDIHLSDGRSFQIFEKVQPKAPIIFTTAYDQYALEAFRTNGIDYLLKPIEMEALLRALEKFETLTLGRVPYEALLRSLKQQTPEYRSRILVSHGQKIKAIPEENIRYCYAEERLVFIKTKDGDRYVADETLDQLQQALNPAHYFRVNRKFLLRFEAIDQMYSYSRSRVKIQLNPPCEQECIVSTDRSPDFKLWLNR